MELTSDACWRESTLICTLKKVTPVLHSGIQGLLDTVFFICKILAGLMQMLLEIVYAF
jgi:hypothetical protein